MGRGRRAYRGLRVYLPERMANQRKALSGITYTWGRWRHLRQQLQGRGSSPPEEVTGLCRAPSRLGKGIREALSPLRPAPPGSLLRASLAGPQDPRSDLGLPSPALLSEVGGTGRWGRGGGGVRGYHGGEAEADQGGGDVPVRPQDVPDALQAVLRRGQRAWAP